MVIRPSSRSCLLTAFALVLAPSASLARYQDDLLGQGMYPGSETPMPAGDMPGSGKPPPVPAVPGGPYPGWPPDPVPSFPLPPSPRPPPPLPPPVQPPLPPAPKPPEPTKPPPPPPPPPRPGPVHTVERGDTLWDLAARYCGSGHEWRSIFQANRDKIKDPHWIYPGQEFRIACDGGAPAGKPPGGDGGGGGGGGKPAGPGNGDRILGPGRNFLSHLPLAPGSYRQSSDFGPRAAPNLPGGGQGSSNHQGVDLSAPSGTPIRAAGAGTVILAEYAGGYGWAVYIKHPNGYVTRYGHMKERPKVRSGQRVGGGEIIGLVGSTGNSTGPHLHFEVRKPDGTAVDPEHYCKF